MSTVCLNVCRRNLSPVTADRTMSPFKEGDLDQSEGLTSAPFSLLGCLLLVESLLEWIGRIEAWQEVLLSVPEKGFSGGYSPLPFGWEGKFSCWRLMDNNGGMGHCDIHISLRRRCARYRQM